MRPAGRPQLFLIPCPSRPYLLPPRVLRSTHPPTLSAEAHIAMVGSASASLPIQRAGLVMASGWARKLISVTPCGERMKHNVCDTL